MMEVDIHVFVDFDGTIMTEDTSDEIFRAAGGFEENLALLKSGKISIFDYWHRFADSVSEKFTPENLIQYLERFTIDSYFKAFVEFCRSYSLPIKIVSDNFDMILRPILTNENLSDLEFYVNKLTYSDGKFVPTFNFASEGCEESIAAVCKRNVILNNISDNALVVFVGDGYSDYGAAEIADVIFAKKNLAKFCAENRIPHFTYKSFFDVKQIFEKLMKEKKIHSRYQAQLARKRLFEME